jgi:hypothetical protein
MMGPWDPNWRPDPTGLRLAGMRAARRGAFAAAAIFGSLVVIASVIPPPLVPSVPQMDLPAGIVIALFSLPGLALLGAGLTSAALGSRSSAVIAGVAIGIGSPVAAVTSAMIGGFLLVGLMDGASQGGDVAGTLLRAGVTAAVLISPLIALGSAGWVMLVRRFAPPVQLPLGEPSRTDPSAPDSARGDPYGPDSAAD